MPELALNPAFPRPLNKRDPAVAKIARAWRTLTARDPGPTLVACSGGADSSALVLALSTITRELVVGHVVHDLRPLAEREADREATRALAVALGIPFACARVAVAAMPGNAEANARRARYAALRALAVETGCATVATAHHATDQLETLLMRLIRGSGPTGLRGIAARRTLPQGAATLMGELITLERAASTFTGLPHSPERIVLIRPMLNVDTAAARAICRAAGWNWQEDRTNADTSRTRAALRALVLPALARIAPAAAFRAGETAALFADLHRSLARAVAPVWRVRRVRREGSRLRSIAFAGAELATLSPTALEYLLRKAHRTLTTGTRHGRLSRRHTRPASERILRMGGGSATFAWPGVTVELQQSGPPRHIRVVLTRDDVPRHARRGS